MSARPVGTLEQSLPNKFSKIKIILSQTFPYNRATNVSKPSTIVPSDTPKITGLWESIAVEKADLNLIMVLLRSGNEFKQTSRVR